MTALKNIYQNGHFSISPRQKCPFSAQTINTVIWFVFFMIYFLKRA
ncbi:hypothetical protein SFK227_3434 [Shigella flexneri K-227]|uniref:Uncharacterized protein n=2 Tax=Shigella flexneri TaxID=623 RepID=F5NZ34_SHIFL|nr:conserved hypothetical protein [Shigella flexneri 2002017]AIL37083.1 hypothetical protein SFy_4003 [Shigella flexneri 2003036]AIL42027.1 hypothetical protein SFyv_4082 [Shigella flexneri Shi06HN006]AKK55319.1 hypothetical protein SF2A_15450 [Shigella flexneri G1663]EFS12309.1 hypothetical protein SF2457T_3458 [Shigella flexneri 2a str. 2457T]EFW57313.1 hypothetical protein SGB_00365 [Shigella boydii ATCC 9905]EGI92664.1 hypothetical protein SB521682_3280 [Shigella boydii 5216-82]EGJ83898.